jgi:hypothetical protein
MAWRVALALVLLAAPCLAQAPAMARGEQLLSISPDECLHRASLALQSEGYREANPGGRYLFGRKENHGVYILCEAGPRSKTRVNILVASASADESVPERESARLQERMEQEPGASSLHAGPSPVAPLPGAPVAPIVLGGSGWRAIARELGGEVGRRYIFKCPANGTPGMVWGTDVYTHDSSVCTAALHQGVIALPRAGDIVIEIRPGQASYPGSTRNGVVSESYGAWYVSFAVIGRAP